MVIVEDTILIVFKRLGDMNDTTDWSSGVDFSFDFFDSSNVTVITDFPVLVLTFSNTPTMTFFVWRPGAFFAD
jgi:hypothetical protein